MQDIFSDLEQKLEKALQHTRSEIAKLRTGKASVSLLDSVMVEAYGSMMHVNELANITAPDSTLLVVTPWDKTILEVIEKGIASSGLNLNPVVDGDIIRIAIPPLTEERRKEMVKLLHQKIEQGKVMMRTVRSDAKRDIEGQKGEEGISEDDIKHNLEELENVFKKYLEKLDVMASDKEKELLTV